MAKNYEQKEMAHKVRLMTTPNGYSLDVDGNGYMYFTLAELVEGFYIHVGLDIVDYCDSQTMRDLMTACATWPKEGDAIKAVAGLEAKVQALEQAHQRDLRNIDTLKARMTQAADELAKTKKRLSFYIEENEKQKKQIAKLENPDAEQEDEKPKVNWKKGQIRKAEIPSPKKIIKVKPGPPIDKPAKMERRGRPPKTKDHEELEQKLKAKGVLK